MQQLDLSSEIQTSTEEATSTARATSSERKFSRMNLAVFLCSVILFSSSYECKSLVGKGKKNCCFDFFKFLVDTCPFWGPLIPLLLPLLWIAGSVLFGFFPEANVM